jgi:taurine dioxygenase
VEVIPQSNTIGAEIRGVDLSENLTDTVFKQINQAFLDYQIIFFRDQDLSLQQYNDFASRFGPLKDYLFADGIDGFPFITEIVKTETETESFGSFWHSDSTYLQLPPKATMLYARQVPPKGGDTLFSDMNAAYEDLSNGMKEMLAPLKAVNSASVFSRDEDIYEAVKSKNSDKKDQQAIHPVIRTHDETGRKSIYVNGIHTLRLEGMTPKESIPILSYLYDQVSRPEYSYRLHWQENTLAIWDNRCTQHYAVNDYHGYRRVMHRIIVEGECPR